MTKTNRDNPAWQCRICGDIRYETVKSERIIGEGGHVSIIGRMHYCKGCGVLFRDPHLFNGARNEEHESRNNSG